MTYPYLGMKIIDGKYLVVFFTNPGLGVIVHSDIDEPRYKLGNNTRFNEDEFDFYPEGQTVVLMN